MLGSFVIVFREMLEAALIVGIVLAATRGIPGRGRWIGAGLLAGLAGAGIVAGSAEWLTSLADGMGQELFNAGVLGLAVLMLAWHNIWMSRHGAELAAQVRQVGRSIQDGKSECSVLALVVGLAVLREGSETVLFLYGVSMSSSGSGLSLVAGGILGALAGAGVGGLLYAGLLRIPLRWFFGATGALVLLLAAGMASQAAHHLIQADLLPALADPLWDSSGWLPQGSAAGLLLHSLIGYEARPAGMQVVFYLMAFAAILTGMNWSRRSQKFSLPKTQGATA
ncbi:MAG: FTR1 family protein [Rhodocyclaceae bacterium]|nr:FTR1 family protein [Rhodocyclaceae bacterium]